jgi:hypothetical protein
MCNARDTNGAAPENYKIDSVDLTTGAPGKPLHTTASRFLSLRFRDQGMGLNAIRA